MVGHSEDTYEPTIRALALCEQHDIPLPDLAAFATRMPFTEFHGWGHAKPRSYYD